MSNPSPQSIIKARHAAKLTQAASAKLVYVSRRAWLLWEHGQRTMPESAWELYLLKAFTPGIQHQIDVLREAISGL